MLVENIVWTEDYAVGVLIIDNAHKELFRIAKRLTLLSHEKSKLKWVAEEGLKYLKSYTVKHFAEEEAYMRSISYPNLPQHMEQHITLREKVLPRLESQLRAEKFSEEAVDKFLAIIQLWLARHILIHDTAITKEEISLVD